MTYHFIVGDHAAKQLTDGLAQQDNVSIIVLKDILNVGPLVKEEGQTFSELRSSFWQTVAPHEKQ
ncbi:MAG TPA: DUF1835 domain-containing protein, partial [Chitinophagaceae bacterium]|nr:DUF1835 domain-containing protein [Chitinophagaceae bacterium]